MWKAATIWPQLEASQPEMIARLRTIAAAADTPNFTEVFAREFAAIQGISIDYAVMEQATDVVVIEAPFRGTTWEVGRRSRG